MLTLHTVYPGVIPTFYIVLLVSQKGFLSTEAEVIPPDHHQPHKCCPTNKQKSKWNKWNGRNWKGKCMPMLNCKIFYFCIFSHTHCTVSLALCLWGCLCVFVSLSVCIYVYIQVLTWTDVNIYIYIQIHLYTYTHIYIFRIKSKEIYHHLRKFLLKSTL